MRANSLLIFVILFMCLLPVAIVPACGWYWPILGFAPPDFGCPNLCGGPALPPPNDAMLPGTLQWGYPPVGRAELVYPGCAYGSEAFRNHLSFGASLPFGYTASGLGPVSGGENATSTKGAPANKKASNATNSDTLSGWLSSRP